MQSASTWTPVLALALTAAGCSDPAAGKPAAAIGSPATPPVAEAEPQEPATAKSASVLSFTQQGSSIQMVGSKVTGSHDIVVKEFKGDVSLAEGAPLESGKVNVVLQMGSIEADHPKLTKHLHSGDFFMVDKHPTATFESTGIQQGGDEGATHTVTGNLTLRGKTKSITFPATLAREGDAVTVKASFSIDRQDFGISYPGMPDDLIRDDVVIKLDLKAS